MVLGSRGIVAARCARTLLNFAALALRDPSYLDRLVERADGVSVEREEGLLCALRPSPKDRSYWVDTLCDNSIPGWLTQLDLSQHSKQPPGHQPPSVKLLLSWVSLRLVMNQG